MVVMGNIKKRVNLRTKKGFTLIELVVVMAIIAVLAALIIGAIAIARQQARDTQLRNDAKSIETYIEKYYGDNQSMPPGVDQGVSGSNNDRQAYVMLQNGESLNKYLPDPSHPPTNQAQNGGTICYVHMYSVPNEYRLWVVTEETAAKLLATGVCTVADTCKCNFNTSIIPAGDIFHQE